MIMPPAPHREILLSKKPKDFSYLFKAGFSPGIQPMTNRTFGYPEVFGQLLLVNALTFHQGLC
nr:Uncharacterised protein [Raoultella sp. NCTC 9187]